MSKLNDLLPFYVLGATTDKERLQIEAYLARKPTLKEEIAILQRAVEMLAHDTEPITPLPETKEKLMQRVAFSQPVTPSSLDQNYQTSFWHRLRWWRLAQTRAFSLLLFILANGFLFWALMLQGRLRSVESANHLLHQQSQAQREALHLYAHSSTQFVQMVGTERAAEAFGRFAYHTETMQTSIWVHGLTPLAASEAYQLWYLTESKPIGAMLFVVTVDGTAMVFWNSAEIPAFSGLAVSIEPAEGSDTPSDKIVLQNIP